METVDGLGIIPAIIQREWRESLEILASLLLQSPLGESFSFPLSHHSCSFLMIFTANLRVSILACVTGGLHTVLLHSFKKRAWWGRWNKFNIFHHIDSSWQFIVWIICYIVLYYIILYFIIIYDITLYYIIIYYIINIYILNFECWLLLHPSIDLPYHMNPNDWYMWRLGQFVFTTTQTFQLPIFYPWPIP